MSRGGRKPQPPPAPPPVPVHVHQALLDAIRATIPATRDWTNNQLVAACLARTLQDAT
jgi:hypothetical protein